MYAGNPSDVQTISTRAVLISSSNQPDELVYAMVKAVFDNFAVFRQLHLRDRPRQRNGNGRVARR
jgi:TRAP-type uncharacterized transport system substrate-binding protein